jgi:hypothetical protein
MRTTARLGTYIGGPIVIESRARVEIHEYEHGWLIDGHRPGDLPHVRSSAKIYRCTDEGRCRGYDCKGHYTAVKRYAQVVALTYGPTLLGQASKAPDLLGALEASLEVAKARLEVAKARRRVTSGEGETHAPG